MAEKDISAASVPEEETAAAAAEKTAKPKKKHTAAYYAAAFFAKIGLTAAVIWALLTFVAGVHICHDNNAYPFIRDGDFCLTYRHAGLRQGTMIVYKQDGKLRYGRIIAKGGDSVEIFNDYITVNDYGISDNTVYQTSPEGSAISYPYRVPEDCVFVLNDRRSDISDSRTYGGIPLDDVEGAVVFTMRMRGI